jgi:protein-tyrosine phosphatase
MHSELYKSFQNRKVSIYNREHYEKRFAFQKDSSWEGKHYMRIAAFLLVFTIRFASASDIQNAVCEQTGENSYRITFDDASATNEVAIFASSRPDRLVSKKPLVKVQMSPVELSVPGTGRIYFHLKPKNGRVRVVSVRRLPLQASFNFRDFGGYPAADGKYVKWGLLYRSGRLDALTAKDFDYLESIGLKLICDLRNTGEWKKAETKWASHNAPEILHDPLYTSQENTDGTANGNGPNGSAPPGGQAPGGPGPQNGQPPNLQPPQSGQAASGPGPQNGQPPDGLQSQDIKEIQVRPYAWPFGEAREPLAVALRRIVTGDMPILFHCNAGKDRTGMAAALVLSLLGVSREIILQDYSLTNASAERLTSFAEFAPDFPNKEFVATDLRTFLGVNVRGLKATMEQMDEKYGSVEAYCIKELKLTPADISKLRKRLLER